MAMMRIVAEWWGRRGVAGLPEPQVLTVDHGLRAESAAEAAFVAAAAKRLGLNHVTLQWTGSKPATGLQEAARQARYDLILGHLAAGAVACDLYLAHHLEDQAETLLMRLARGSGIDGLSAMRPIERRTAVVLGAPVREVTVELHRPLLTIAKDRLIATLHRAGDTWVEDPSNADPRFERVRLRQAMTASPVALLSPAMIALSAARLGRERSALMARAADIAARDLDDHGGAYGTLRIAEGPAPADIVRIAGRMLTVFGGAAEPAQLSQIETLVERVMSPLPTAPGRLTLGGCLVEIAAGTAARAVMVSREAAREPLPVVTLEPGQGVFWDRRFYISLDQMAPAPVTVGPCSSRTPAAPLPRGVLASLPGLAGDEGTEFLLGCSAGDATCVWPLQHQLALRWRDMPQVNAATN